MTESVFERHDKIIKAVIEIGEKKPFPDTEDSRCYDCPSWVGRCLKGKVNRIAKSPVCELFR